MPSRGPATSQQLRSNCGAKTKEFCHKLADLIAAEAEREPEVQAPN
jgi:hypothetical protein